METFQNIMIMVLFFVLAINPTTGDVGDNCLRSQRCDRGEVCVDGFCLCEKRSKPNFKLSVLYKSRSLAPHCDVGSTTHWSPALCANKAINAPWLNISLPAFDLGKFTNCSTFIPHTHCENDECVCDDGYYRIGDQCQKENVTLVSGPMEKCGTSDKILLCDIEEHLRCQNYKCICFDTLVPNLDKKVCEPEADYVKRNNLKEYRVLPGEYCKEDRHCIEGLVCRNYNCSHRVLPGESCEGDRHCIEGLVCYNNKCSCRVECRILRKDNYIFCDCGVTEQGILGPFGTGLILGLMIMVCWSYTIKSTIKKFKKHTPTREPERPEETPAPSYLRQPTVPAAAANAGPSSLTTDTSPVIGKSDNIQPPNLKSPHNPLNPTMGATPYSINSGQPSAFSIDEPPPSYSTLDFSQPADNPSYPHTYIPLSTTPSRPDSPAQNQPITSGPSYPLNPPASSPSAPAYPLGPTAPLYPPNPSAPAYPISPSNLPSELEALQPPYNPNVKEGFTDDKS